MTWIDPGPTDPTDTTTFAYRLYEQLLPFQAFDTENHLWALCDGIYAMFQEVEELTKDRDDELPGYANIVDINACRSDFLPWLAQFVGAVVKPGLSDQAQRDYITSLPGFARGRPATIKAAVAATLIGTQFVDVRERSGGAWKFTVVTKPSETPNVALTTAAMMDQKPGPDIAELLMVEYVDYQWVTDGFTSYGTVTGAYATYQDLTNSTP